jgi:hypothetical protein
VGADDYDRARQHGHGDDAEIPDSDQRGRAQRVRQTDGVDHRQAGQCRGGYRVRACIRTAGRPGLARTTNHERSPIVLEQYAF